MSRPRNLFTRWAAKAHGGCPRTHLSYTYLELVCLLLLGDYYQDAWPLWVVLSVLIYLLTGHYNCPYVPCLSPSLSWLRAELMLSCSRQRHLCGSLFRQSIHPRQSMSLLSDCIHSWDQRILKRVMGLSKPEEISLFKRTSQVTVQGSYYHGPLLEAFLSYHASVVLHISLAYLGASC